MVLWSLVWRWFRSEGGRRDNNRVVAKDQPTRGTERRGEEEQRNNALEKKQARVRGKKWVKQRSSSRGAGEEEVVKGRFCCCL